MECKACRKEILSNQSKIRTGDESFHSSCFICNECKKPLAGLPYYPKDDTKVCSDCFTAAAPRCIQCSKPVVEQSTKLSDGSVFHPKCFKCVKCKKPIDSAYRTNSNGKFEHTPSCDKPDSAKNSHCKDCGRELVNVKFFTLDNGKKSCADCYREKHSSNCYKCTEPILEGKSHIVKDWKFHQQCFNCPNCEKYLGGRSIKLAGENVVCFNCSDK